MLLLQFGNEMAPRGETVDHSYRNGRMGGGQNVPPPLDIKFLYCYSDRDSLSNSEQKYKMPSILPTQPRLNQNKVPSLQTLFVGILLFCFALVFAIREK